MYDALLALQKQLGEDKMELVVSERLGGNPVDAGAAIRQYADQGFDIVIAHGAQFQSVVFEVAEDFPRPHLRTAAHLRPLQRICI